MPKLQKKKSESSGAPEWMATYGDLVTLLLCFFVLLFSFSDTNVRKFQSAMSSLQGAFGQMPGMSTVSNGGLNNSMIPMPHPKHQQPVPSYSREKEETKKLEEIKKNIQHNLAQKGIKGIAFIMEERGLVIRVVDKILFDLGDARVRNDAKGVLDIVASIIKKIPNHVRIEGNTDSLPIKTAQFPSNWELSAARAVNVTRYFVHGHSISPLRLSFSGYAEFRPVNPNNLKRNRPEDRRVDIVILRTEASESASGIKIK